MFLGLWEVRQIHFSGPRLRQTITGKTVVVPASDTATTLGAAILAGVGVGFYKDYEEAVSMTVKETRRP